ncbi:MAG: phospho-N-acetylmuramoyl-pentapeptide-transferase [Fimbriimonadales bacterium]
MAIEVLVATLTALLLGKPVIRGLARLNVRQTIYAYAPETHRTKEGTPTMGGFLILLGVVAGTIALSAQPEKRFAIVPLLSLFAGAALFALIGFVDDHLIRRLTGQRGLEWKTKLILQLLAGAGALWMASQVPTLLQEAPSSGQIAQSFAMGLLGLVWLVGWVNAFNLTDGLDGLAGGLSVIAFGALSLVARDTYTATTALLWAGACLGYLWWNTHPAKVFMGDTGSMALGAAFGLLTWREITLMPSVSYALNLSVVGAVFAIEVLTVIIQLSAVKTLKRRVFRATPIHHHFELIGWKETEIVVRFWIVGALCAMVALLGWGGGR